MNIATIQYIHREGEITDVLREAGPLTGRELSERLGIDYDERSRVTNLWALCRSSRNVVKIKVSRRYLRINRPDGALYISPSVPREFSDFTALGLDPDEVAKKASSIKEDAKRISERKRKTAETFVTEITHALGYANLNEYFCFLLAGDVTYEMASDAPREAQNGELVRGSDLDIIILHKENIDQRLTKELDDAALTKKGRYLKHPIREEVDYKFKSLEMVAEQADMSTPRDSVAVKIIFESLPIYGNQLLYGEVLRILNQRGVPKKLDYMMTQALMLRDRWEEEILENLGLVHEP